MAIKSTIGRFGEFSYAVKVAGVDDRFFMRPFGRQLDDLRRIQAWQSTAKTYHVGAKHKATLSAVRAWIKMMKPTEFYAKWRSDSTDWKNDSVEIYYKNMRE